MGRGTASHVHTISITATPRTSELGPVKAAAAVTTGTRTYSVDLKTMTERISATPGVRHAAVRRMPNGNLSERVNMYTAVAQWTDGEAFFPLSADGTIVKRPESERDPASVLFRGSLPDDISDITKAAHNLIGNLDYLEWIENRRWDLKTTGGITVKLPEKNPAAAIASLIMLNEKHDLLSRDISIIDMRDEARILVK